MVTNVEPVLIVFHKLSMRAKLLLGLASEMPEYGVETSALYSGIRLISAINCEK